MMPDPLQGIELGGICRQIVYLDRAAIVGEPQPDIPVFVVGRVVLNQEDFSGKVALDDAFQVCNVGLSIEHCLKMVEEPCTIQLDRAKGLECVPLPGGRYFRLRTYSRPRAVERRVLPEARFVFVKEGGTFPFGFFLILGYLYLVQRSCAAF